MEHEKLDAVEDEPTYWHYSFPEMAKYDIPAFIAAIREETGYQKKVRYIGTSLGTTQAFYALQAEHTKQFMIENVHSVTALAPVIVPNVDSMFEMSLLHYDAYKTLLESLHSENQVFGPRFDERVDDVCKLFKLLGARDTCDTLKHLNDSAEDGWEAVPTRLLLHYSQNYLSNRFQEFSECWGILACHKSKQIDLSEITDVPINFLFGTNDDLASIEFQKELVYEIQAPTTVAMVYGFGHHDFMNGQPNKNLHKMIFKALDGKLKSVWKW